MSDRPKIVEAVTPRVPCACGMLYAIMGSWEAAMQELQIKLGPQGSCSAAVTNALAIVISICLQGGVPAPVIAEVLRRDSGLCPKAHDSNTCIVALGETMTDYVGEVSDEEFPSEPMKLSGTERKRLTGCGHVEVICLDDSDGNLRKVKAELAKTNTCANTVTRALSQLVTVGLAYGVDPARIAKGLGGISCPASNHESSSCLDAISQAIVAHEKAKAMTDEDINYIVNQNEEVVTNG